MAHLKIPTAYDRTKVLLVDDEPEHLGWFIDYLKAKGLTADVRTNVRDALDAIESLTYRAYIVDLTIPLGEWIPNLGARSGAFNDYHGLYVLQLVRSQGNSGGLVVAYSVHNNEQVAAEIKRLYCGYVAKGRPLEFKREVEQILKKERKPKKRAVKHAGKKSRKRAGKR